MFKILHNNINGELVANLKNMNVGLWIIRKITLKKKQTKK